MAYLPIYPAHSQNQQQHKSALSALRQGTDSLLFPALQLEERKKELCRRTIYAHGYELRKKRGLHASLPYPTPKEPKPCGRVDAQQTNAPEGEFDKGQAHSQRAGCASCPPSSLFNRSPALAARPADRLVLHQSPLRGQHCSRQQLLAESWLFCQGAAPQQPPD